MGAPLTRRRLLHQASGAGGERGRPRCSAPRPRPGRRGRPDGHRGRRRRLPRRAARRRTAPGATFAFADKERQNWHYVPRQREGLPFKHMPRAARAAAHELMKASLSAVGYGKAVNVIRLEEVLRRLETFGGLLARSRELRPHHLRRARPRRALGLAPRGPSPLAELHPRARQAHRGDPRLPGRQSRRGAHGAASGPADAGREEDLARALAQSTDARQRPRMLIGGQSLGDIVSGPGRGERLATPAGLPLGRDDGRSAGHGPPARGGVRAEHARRDRRGGAAPPAGGGPGAAALRLGGAARARQGALLSPPRAHPAHRVRQYPERRQSHPLGVARPAERLRPGSPPRPLRARAPPPPRQVSRRSVRGAAGRSRRRAGCPPGAGRRRS